MGKCQGDCGIPQPSLQSEDMPQKPLDVSTPLFYPRAEEQQASLPGEQPRDANAARIHKSVRVCSHMVHHKIPRTKLRGIFYCCFPEKQELGTPSGARRARVFQAVKKLLLGRALLARARLSVKKLSWKKRCCVKSAGDQWSPLHIQ